MAINLTDALNAATTKGKLADAKQIYLEGDNKNLQDAHKDNEDHLSTLDTRSTQIEESLKTIAATGGASNANAVIYDNNASGLTAINVKGALDELAMRLKDEFSYKGIATPTTNPGTPNGNVFYIAGEGTYVNFSGLSVDSGELAVLKWNGTWSKQTVKVGLPPNELNISYLFPTNGEGGTNKYTIETAIAQVPAELRSSVNTVSFLNQNGKTEKWEFRGGSWAVSGFSEVGSNVINKMQSIITHIYEVKDFPYIFGKLVSRDGRILSNIWNDSGSVACKCLIINVKNVEEILYNKSFYVQNGGTVFLGENKNFISFFDGTNKQVTVPNEASIAAINFPTEVDFNFKLKLKDGTNDYIDNNLNPCLIDGIFDGTTYNYNWWDSEGSIPEAFLALSKNGIVDNIYVGEEYISYDSGDRNDLSSWSATSGKYFFKSVEDLVFEFNDDLLDDIEVFIAPKQTEWNNGAVLTDKAGNIMPGVSRNNSLSSFTAYTGTKRVQIKDPSNYINGKVYLYTKSRPVTGIVKPVTANRVLLNNIFSGRITLSDELINIQDSSRKQIYKNYCALFVSVLPNTTYYIFGSPSLTTVANVISDYPVVECNSDRKIINKISKNDISILNRAILLNNKVMSIYKFTTSSDTSYICFDAYNNNSTINLTELKVVVCADFDLYNAIKLENCELGYNKLKADSISKSIVRLDKNIWLLGDSISGTGYGGILEGVEGGGNGAWGKYFIDIILPKSMYNYAAGGYSITDASTTFNEDGILQNTNASYIKMLETAIKDYQAGKISAPDYLIINGCTNDFGKTRNNPNGWSNRSFVTKEDLQSQSLNPNNLDYDEFMDKTFITDSNATMFNTNILKDISTVPMFKIAGAVRYIVQRVSVLFPNCKFLIVSSIPAPNSWIDQKKCHRELRWIAERLSIPYIPVNEASNICLLNDMPKKDGGYGTPDNPDNPRRFIADGFHPYGSTDSEGVSFITAGAMYQGKFIAEFFKQYCMPLSDKDIQVIDFRDSTRYPHEYNVNS